MLAKHSTTELYPQPSTYSFFKAMSQINQCLLKYVKTKKGTACVVFETFLNCLHSNHLVFNLISTNICYMAIPMLETTDVKL
jgi:hypothetical protein